MIARYMFMRLSPQFATPESIGELRARALALRSIAGVQGVSVARPADAVARAAWELCVVLRCDSLGAIERVMADPEFVAYAEGVVAPRVAVLKAWNFEE